MSSVTINGNTYSADGSTPKDMLNGGHRTHFIPLCSDVATVAGQVQNNADQTAIDAVNAADGANAMRGTSTTSTAVGAGTKTFTTQAGKQFTGGNYVTVSRTSAPTTLMHGVVTSYSGTTLTVDVSTVAGSGTHTDWTIALSGAKGNNGPSGAGDLPYIAKTSAYTLLSTDKGKLIDCTSGTFTLGFSACATLGANWTTYIKNSGTGKITLDPNGAELINGAATFALNPGVLSLVQCDGTVLRLYVVDSISRLPIFSAAAAILGGVSSGEFLYNEIVTPLGAGVSKVIVYGNSLFVAAPGTGASSANVASSPDGATWTLRAMPSTKPWEIGTNGTNQFIAVNGSGTETANSSNGTTWAAATPTPAVPGGAGRGLPIYVGSTCLVISSVASTAYTTADMAASAWATQTLPEAAGAQAPFSVGGLFWYWSATNAAYTSATGATGSWTLRTLPGNYASVTQDFDGALIGYFSGSQNLWRSTDGITWVDLGFVAQSGATYKSINGVGYVLSASFGSCMSRHAESWVIRSSKFGDQGLSYLRSCKNPAGDIFLHTIGNSSSVVRIATTESTAPLAFFGS